MYSHFFLCSMHNEKNMKDSTKLDSTSGLKIQGGVKLAWLPKSWICIFLQAASNNNIHFHNQM